MYWPFSTSQRPRVASPPDERESVRMLRRMARGAVPERVERTVRYDMPIVQRLRYLGGPVPLRFAEDAAAWIAHDDEVGVRRAHRGLELRAVNEDALSRAASVLRQVYGDDIDLMPPQVHYREGAQLLEPIMHFRIDCAPDHRGRIKRLLAARGAPILTEEAQDTSFVLRGTAPLAALLGVGAQLDACAAERVSFWSWLSHYAPADPDGGDAA